MKSATASADMNGGRVVAVPTRHALTRRVALTVNHFTVVLSNTASTNLITFIPTCSADRYAPLDRCRLYPSPRQTPRIYTHIQLL
jgi:hypothetical protein